MGLASKLFKGDRVIWVIFIFLCLISVIEVFSATSTLAYKNSNLWMPIIRHTGFLVGGLIVILILLNIHYRWFRLMVLLVPVSIILLIVTPLVGISANDAYRWLSFGGVQIQPSELAKLGSIVFVAFMLSKRRLFTDNQIFWWTLFAVVVTCALILPENLSTAFILFVVCYSLMFIGQVPFVKWFLVAIVLLLVVGAFFASWFVVPEQVWKELPVLDRVPTWKKRIAVKSDENTFDAKELFNGDNYQVTHAKIAIARGGISPQGPGHGKQRDFLPQAYSDFIYAIIIEELGLWVGGLGVLLLYMWLLIRVGMIARKCDELFPKFLVLGCGLSLVVQALVNMAVAVDLMPVTGQPMPLVSRGGTSTIISCVYIGIILSISRFSAHTGDEDEEDEQLLEVKEPSEVPLMEGTSQVEVKA